MSVQCFTATCHHLVTRRSMTDGRKPHGSLSTYYCARKPTPQKLKYLWGEADWEGWAWFWPELAWRVYRRALHWMHQDGAKSKGHLSILLRSFFWGGAFHRWHVHYPFSICVSLTSVVNSKRKNTFWQLEGVNTDFLNTESQINSLPLTRVGEKVENTSAMCSRSNGNDGIKMKRCTQQPFN